MNISYALFDMDGLLLDTESLGITMCRRAGEAFGYDIPETLVLKTLGMSAARSDELYKELFPRFETTKFWTLFRELMLRYMQQHGVPVKPGVRVLLQAMKDKGIRASVVSGTRENAAREYLSLAGLLDAFDFLVCGAPDMPSKPAPDMYLRAANLAGVAPEDCLVLEDSENGVRAGRAAGCHVCMIPDLIPYSNKLAPYCDLVLPSLADVIERL